MQAYIEALSVKQELKEQGLTTTEHVLLKFILTCAKRVHSDAVELTNAYLSREIEVSTRHVRRLIDSLCDKGFIERFTYSTRKRVLQVTQKASLQLTRANAPAESKEIESDSLKIMSLIDVPNVPNVPNPAPKDTETTPKQPENVPNPDVPNPENVPNVPNPISQCEDTPLSDLYKYKININFKTRTHTRERATPFNFSQPPEKLKKPFIFDLVERRSLTKEQREFIAQYSECEIAGAQEYIDKKLSGRGNFKAYQTVVAKGRDYFSHLCYQLAYRRHEEITSSHKTKQTKTQEPEITTMQVTNPYTTPSQPAQSEKSDLDKKIFAANKKYAILFLDTYRETLTKQGWSISSGRKDSRAYVEVAHTRVSHYWNLDEPNFKQNVDLFIAKANLEPLEAYAKAV